MPAPHASPNIPPAWPTSTTLIAREYDCLHNERQRTLQRQARASATTTRHAEQATSHVKRVKQEMDKEQRRMEESDSSNSPKSEELLELRRRKLIMQLSGVFNIVPLHSKKERET